MGIASRIHSTLNDWAEEWGDKLRAWWSKVVMNGVESTFDFFEPDLRAELTPMLDRLKTIPNLPPDIKAIFEKAESEPQAVQFAFLLPMAVGMLLGAGLGMAQPIMNLGQYEIDKFVRSARLDPFIATRALFRQLITPERFTETVKDLGWSDADIQTILDVSHYYPSPLELVNWQAKEVFEPTMREYYGLGAELDELERDAFYKAGMTDEQINNFWMAHWVHPSLNVVFDLLHRGEITEDEMYQYYRVVEIPPIWRDKLTAISWDIPNRIELRMMARYGLVDKSFLVEMLKKVGLAAEFRDVAADMMLSMGIRTDLSTRYSKGWIDADGVKADLVASGLSPEVQDRMYQWIVKNTSGDRVTSERDLTLTDIYKGIKKEIINRAQGKELIQAMGYDEYEAEFKLNINIPIEETVSAIKDRELTKTDVLKGLKAEVLTEVEARTRLAGLRYIPVDIDLLIAIFNAAIKPPVEARSREASKADIVAAVKKGLIEPKEGYLMLQDIGFTAEASEFILMVRAETSPFSPYSYQELNKTIQLYRRTQGLSYKIPSEELIQAEKDAKELGTEEAKIRFHQLLREERGEN